jgi:hypothetical protein
MALPEIFQRFEPARLLWENFETSFDAAFAARASAARSWLRIQPALPHFQADKELVGLAS